MLRRHLSIYEWFGGNSMSLCGPSPSSILFLKQESCDDHEVIRKHGSSHEQFESFATFGEATLHAATAEENGDASFDAGTKALAILKRPAFFMGCLDRRFFAAALRDAYEFDAGVFAILDVSLAEKSPIGIVEFWYFFEGFLVTLQRVFDVDIVRRISVEHPILGDQPAGALREVNFMPKLHRLQDLPSFDQVGVSLENRKDLLFIRDLFLVEHATTCLINNLVPKTAIMIDLLSNGLDCYVSHQINAAHAFSLFECLTCVSDHLIRGVDEFAIFRDQLILPLFGRHPLDLLHPASGTASAIGKSRHALGEQFIEISNQPTNDADCIPQQGTIHWVVDVRFDHGRIDAQFFAIFQSEINGGIDDQIVDYLECLRREPVKRLVERIMFGNESAVETSESPQSIPVIDALSQFAVFPVLHSLQDKRAQHLLGGEAVAARIGILQATLKISAHLVYQVTVLVNEIGDGLQHRLQANALGEKLNIGKTDLTARRSCHFLAFAFLRFL